MGRREKGDKNIWYVSSTTNCCYKENIDIIYQLHGGYRKDKTLTSLLQSSNSFVFITSLSPDHFAWMFYLLSCSSLKNKTSRSRLDKLCSVLNPKVQYKAAVTAFFYDFQIMSSFVWKSCYKFQTDFVSNFQTSLRHNIFPLCFRKFFCCQRANFAKLSLLIILYDQKCKSEPSDHFGAWATTSLAILMGGPLWVRPSNLLKV